jgi:hypothetical protein
MPFEKLERDIPLKMFFSMKSPNGASLSQTTSYEIKASKSTGAFQRRVLTRRRKRFLKTEKNKLQLQYNNRGPLGATV